jgi:putative Holliday junction resolvase
MKSCALDIGDVWTGTAISDVLGLTARPYKTVTTKDLIPFLDQLLKQEQIATIVIGYPITMRGTESEQTLKVLAMKEKLQDTFPDVQFVLFDERMTSKQASGIKHAKTKTDKIASHSIAAALILSTYLVFASNHRM